jgi:hypothetical protein
MIAVWFCARKEKWVLDLTTDGLVGLNLIVVVRADLSYADERREYLTF